MSDVLANAATTTNRLDLIVVAVYLMMMVVAGGVLARYNKSARDLFAGGGNAPWWLAGISTYMIFFSAGTFVVWGSLAYAFGWLGITIQWTIAAALIALGVTGTCPPLMPGRATVLRVPRFFSWPM